MKIKKPIFILASPRSGTTILYNLFTRHKDTAFPEHFVDKYWESPWKFRFIPILVKQQMFRYKIRPLPHEGKFLSKFFPYGTPLDNTHVTQEIRKYLYSLIEAEIKAFKAKRFVCKQVDFSFRIKFLNSIFPDANYIIIWRDPRAVVESLYTQMSGPWKTKSRDDPDKGWLAVTENFGENETLLESCIDFYNKYVHSIKRDLHLIKDRTIQINYEDLVVNPRNEFKKLFSFTRLGWYNELNQEIPKQLKLNTNQNWKKLSESEKEIIEKTFGSNENYKV